MRTALDKTILCKMQKRKEATQQRNLPESESPRIKDPQDLRKENGPPAKRMTLTALLQPRKLHLVNTLGDAAIFGESSTGGKKISKEDKEVKTQLTEDGKMKNEAKKRKKEKAEEYIRKRFKTSFSLESLSFHRVLGEGSYGKVLLASDLRNNKSLAVKVVKKRAMLGTLRESIFVERRVLEIATGSAFLTHAYGTFQTKDHLFFVMEYLSGGDLFSYLEQNGRLDLRTVTFFAAEIVCGLQYLHLRGIIHRDLKPENILLDSTGHLKIADFGLALEGVFGKRTARGYAGTLGYIAPEMLKGKSYNAAVDWWAFGVILYEMVTGEDPFYCGDTSEKVARSALQDTPYYPEYLSADTKHLLVKLLCKKPSRRLGATGSIREHPFFQSIDWKELEAGTLDSPISPSTPSLDGFLPLAEGKAISSSEARKTPIGIEEQMIFNGFSFTSPKWNI